MEPSTIFISRNGVLMEVIEFVTKGKEKSLLDFVTIDGIFEDVVSGELFTFND